MTRPVVGLVDYQAGNLRSIENAFEHLGASVRRIRQPGDLDACSHVVLPGVGAFGFCAERFATSGLAAQLQEWTLDQQRPMLGICVGMQLLADSSEESPDVAGLGWLGGPVERLPASAPVVRVPHVGWNTVTFHESWGDFGSGDKADFYFDHSFALVRPTHASVTASCEHGTIFSAVARRGRLIAAQFHPEKSQNCGLRFLQGFLAT